MTQQLFFLKIDGFLKRIILADILFLETNDNYTKIYQEEGFHIVRITLKMALQELESNRFVQVHRSFAVNVDKIDEITGESVYLFPLKPNVEIKIPFSKKKYWPELYKRIKILGPKIESGEEFDSEIE
jgi:DNA-binding LytR/AlgR family response regulator